jgi:hypothetical protein
MSSYLSRYIGASRLPRNLPDFDVDIYFQLPAKTIAAIRERFQSDRKPGAVDRMIALAAQVVFMRATGRPMDSMALIPPSLLRHIGGNAQRRGAEHRLLAVHLSAPTDRFRSPAMGSRASRSRVGDGRSSPTVVRGFADAR